MVERHPLIAAQILSRSRNSECRELHQASPRNISTAAATPTSSPARPFRWARVILHVAEAFDSMVTKKSYAKRCCPKDALAEIWNCAGHQFDPKVVEVLDTILRRSDCWVPPSRDADEEPAAAARRIRVE